MRRCIVFIVSLIMLIPTVNAKRINVKRFGALGNGTADDTEAIQRAVLSVKDGDVLIFPSGTYNIRPSVGNSDLIKLESLKDVTVKGRKSILKILPNALPSYNVIKIHNCNNITIKKIVLQGDRVGHDYKSCPGTHEFGYGIYVLGDSELFPVNVTIENCNIYDMTGDAIVTKNGVSSGTININSCQLHHCRRQGISVLDSDEIIICDCNIFEIGTSNNVAGTAPMAGIDIEPRSGTKRVNRVLVRNSSILNCDYISIVGDPTYIEVYDSTLEDMSIHENTTYDIIPSGRIARVLFKADSDKKLHYGFKFFELHDCTFDLAPVSLTEIWAAGLYNCTLSAHSVDDSKGYLLNCRAKASCCAFNNLNIINSNSSHMGEQDHNIYNSCHFVLYSTPKYPFKNCSFFNCTSDKSYSQTVYLENCTVQGDFLRNPIEWGK